MISPAEADIIEALGGPALADIDETEFDDLFVLTLCSCHRHPARLVRFQYGALSPTPP